MIYILARADSDPDVKVGGYLTLERADGRSVWRQRLIVTKKNEDMYCLMPVDEMHGIEHEEEKYGYLGDC